MGRVIWLSIIGLGLLMPANSFLITVSTDGHQAIQLLTQATDTLLSYTLLASSEFQAFFPQTGTLHLATLLSLFCLLLTLYWVRKTILKLRKAKLEQQSLEEKYRSLKEMNKTILNVIPSPILIKDHKGIPIDANSAFYQLFQLSPEQIIHQDGHELAYLTPIQSAKHQAEDRLVLQGDTLTSQEMTSFIRGEEHHLHYEKHPYLLNQEANGLVVAMNDITRQEEVENKYCQLIQESEKINTELQSQLAHVQEKLKQTEHKLKIASELNASYSQQPQKAKPNALIIVDELPTFTSLINALNLHHIAPYCHHLNSFEQLATEVISTKASLLFIEKRLWQELALSTQWIKTNLQDVLLVLLDKEPLEAPVQHDKIWSISLSPLDPNHIKAILPAPKTVSSSPKSSHLKAEIPKPKAHQEDEYLTELELMEEMLDNTPEMIPFPDLDEVESNNTPVDKIQLIELFSDLDAANQIEKALISQSGQK